MSILERAGQLVRALTRVDGWWNLVTGVGTGLGRNAFTFAAEARLDDQTLEDIFDGDSFGARVCDAVPKYALRRGFKLATGDAAVDTALAARMRAFGAREALFETWTWARCFGGACLFVGAADGLDPAQPLDLSSVRTVHFLTVLDKRELVPRDFYRTPLHPKFGEPKTYQFVRTGTGGGTDTSLVHESRLIRFDGALTTKRRRQQNRGWSNSELQRVFDKLRKFNAAYEAGSALLQDASQGVFKVKDLISMMAGDAQDALRTRLALMDASRSVGRAIMVDAEAEDFERIEVGALTGLPPTLESFMLLLSGAAEIPVTILMGRAPAGLNATGESDIRAFYDRIEADRPNLLDPKIERLARILCAAQDGPTGGVQPKSLTVEYPSLWQPTPMEEADLRLKTAQTDQIYIDKQVLTPEEVALNRFRPEGWSAKTTIDLKVRRAALEADQQPEGELPAGDVTPKPGQLPPGGAPGAAAQQDADAEPAPDFRADAAGNRGVAIVLVVPAAVAALVAVPDGEAPADLHVTMAYVGTIDGLDDERRALLRGVTRAWAARTAPLVATLGAQGRFLAMAGATDPVYLAPQDCPELYAARCDLVCALATVGVPESETYREFTPHVTVAYVPKGAPSPAAPAAPLPVTFESAGLWMGDAREAFALTGGM
jgi:phage-related protein (TIGR01555 family)